MSETDRVRKRYEARLQTGADARWSGLEPASHLAEQEKERALVRWLRETDVGPIANVRLLDVGCGTGDDLLRLIRLGFDPSHLVGVELLEERAEHARSRLPEAVAVHTGDATTLELPRESFDVVFQSTVFTSLLSDDYQQSLAAWMWDRVRPGGGVLWIDFRYDNPRNPDVRGVPLSRVRELFPASRSIRTWRVGLAPPVARAVTRLHPSLYGLFNTVPLLRTHVMCWIAKADPS